jgi:hypothetical protein
MPSGVDPVDAIPIPPLKAGQVIGATFRHYGAHVRPLLVISLITNLVVFVVSELGTRLLLEMDTDTGSDASVVVAPVVALVVLLVTGLATAVMTRIVALDLAGLASTASDGLRYAGRRWGSIVVVSLLVGALVFVEVLIGSLLAGALHAPILLILVVLGCLFVILAFSLSIPALVIEDKRGSESLSRSWGLVMSAFGHALGVTVLSYLIALGGLVAAVMILGVAGADGDVAFTVMNLILQTLLLPFFATVVVALSVNLRVKDGGLSRATLKTELGRSN